jgi:hypothetical protein
MKNLFNRLASPLFWADFTLILAMIITVLIVVNGYY